jgi:hypothetical protein
VRKREIARNSEGKEEETKSARHGEERYHQPAASKRAAEHVPLLAEPLPGNQILLGPGAKAFH